MKNSRGKCSRKSWTAPFTLASSLAVLISCKHPESGGAKSGAARGAEPTGVVAFTRHSRFVDAKISPKGTYLAAVTTEGGRRSLAFINLTTRQFASALKPDSETMVGNFYWANDERVVVELVDQDGDTFNIPTTLQAVSVCNRRLR